MIYIVKVMKCKIPQFKSGQDISGTILKNLIILLSFYAIEAFLRGTGM